MSDDNAVPSAATAQGVSRLGLILAGSWCLVFAGVHVYWALGGDAGLAESGPEQTRWSMLWWNPWFAAGGATFLLASTNRDRRSRNVLHRQE